MLVGAVNENEGEGCSSWVASQASQSPKPGSGAERESTGVSLVDMVDPANRNGSLNSSRAH